MRHLSVDDKHRKNGSASFRSLCGTKANIRDGMSIYPVIIAQDPGKLHLPQ